MGVAGDAVEQGLALLAQHGPLAVEEDLRETVDGAQRRAQVVGDGVGERLLLAQRLLQGGGARVDELLQVAAIALQLVLGRNRFLAAIGPGRFRADVDDVHAFGDHLPRASDRAAGVVEPAAVGK